MTFRISLGMIVRNEGRTLKACLESVAPYVDEIVIGLGGESTDNTLEIIQDWNKILEHIPIQYFDIKWTEDFSAARNLVMEKVTGDYFMWLDGDDELVGGEHIRDMVRLFPNVDGFYMGYDYARDENGNCVCYLVRERVVRLQDELPDRGWHWLGKVHEVLAAKGFAETSRLVDDVFVRHHKPADKHEPDRNIKILYKQLAEQEPNPDPRVLGYLCTENAGRGNYKEAILHGQRFVQLSGWTEEKYQMQHRIADMYRVMGDFKASMVADFEAIHIQPNWPDAFLGLAETTAAMDKYAESLEWSKAAATKPVPQTMLIVNPLDYTFTPLIVLAGAYAHLGDFEMSLENYQKAYQIKADGIVGQQIELLKNEINLQRVVQAVLMIREQLGRNDEWLKVRKLYDIIPKHVEQHPMIQETWQRSMFQTGHIVDPKIMEDFYTGNPHWVSMSDEMIRDPEWLKYPRMAFALEVARRINAKTIVDWGCSDGFISLPLAGATNAHITGFDLDPRCVALASKRAGEWDIDARFEVGNVDEIGEWEGDKADLGVFFEVIEHVVDPAATLTRLEKTAKHIIMTTPYLSWEGGRIPAWDRLEPKGHLRIMDQFDMERLLWDRGRIINNYREPWGSTGWLFTEYEPGIKYDKTIMIGAMGAPEPWNPRTFETGGLGGSETAVIKLGEAFSRQGADSPNRVIVYSNIDEPGYYNSVGYRDATHFNPEVPSDLFIAWRNPDAADWNINTKRLVLWMHDTDAGDRLTPERARKFHSIVVLTAWHKENMLKRYPFLKPEQLIIIGNGVDLTRFEASAKRNPLRVIYSSSPDRGLDIILEGIWPKVVEAVPEAELHVYYGWNNYDKFAPMYPQMQEFRHKVSNLLLNSKNVVQHGRVNQVELAESFKKSSVWLYPTYFSETYCITAIEAQLGGAIPVTNQLAALEETVGGGVILSTDVRSPEVQEEYAKAVIQILQTPLKQRATLHKQVKAHAPAHDWDWVANLWRAYFFGKGALIDGERPLRPGAERISSGFDQLAN